MEHVLISCRKYETERVMITGLQRLGGARFKDVLECGGSRERKEEILSFLKATGLITRP